MTLLHISYQVKKCCNGIKLNKQLEPDPAQVEDYAAIVMEPSDLISEIEKELQAIEARRHGLLIEVQKLRREMEIPKLPLSAGVPRSSDEKVALFLSLFGARRSVYPRLWENQKAARKGYSPVCRNEWVRGVCEKPRVKCADCPHQDFPPLDHSVIFAHLTGQHTVGTYAICEDDTCVFLVADFDGEECGHFYYGKRILEDVEPDAAHQRLSGRVVVESSL